MFYHFNNIIFNNICHAHLPITDFSTMYSLFHHNLPASKSYCTERAPAAERFYFTVLLPTMATIATQQNLRKYSTLSRTMQGMLCFLLHCGFRRLQPTANVTTKWPISLFHRNTAAITICTMSFTYRKQLRSGSLIMH